MYYSRKIIVVLFLVLNCINLISNENPFRIQRMITDFSGVVSNGNKILCYGDYGIMTYTTDSGLSWEQQSFGDKFNVMKIETDGSDFFGVTDYFMFRSYNNDSYWLSQPIFDEAKIIDMALYNNSIYILTIGGILLSDKEMNINNSPILILDSNYSYSELITDGENLYFIFDSKLLLKYSLKTEVLDTIDLIKEFNCNNCTTVSGIKIFDDNIFAQLSHVASDKNSYYSLVKSEDNGNNWTQLTDNVYKGDCYKVINNEIYFLKLMVKSDSTDSFLTTQYSKVDSSHYQIDSTYFTVINSNDKIERFIRWDNEVLYKDFITINDDTIIAVGSNKLISVSYDKGKTFEFKSFFKTTYGNMNVSVLSDSLIYVVNGYEVYRTKDGGVTWLPQLYNNYNFNMYSSPNIYYLDKNGSGFAKYKYINSNDDSSAIITDDYGENFSKTNDENLTIDTFGGGFPKGLDLGDVVLFVLNPNKDSTGNKSYLFLRYNKSFKFLDSTRLPGDLKNIVRIDDNNIITLNLFTSGENKVDSNGKSENYSYNYFLMKSTDKGMTWDSIDIDVPIQKKLLKSQNGSYYFYADITHRNALHYNNHIFYPSTENIIYRYDYVNNKFDSLFFPAGILNSRSLAIFNIRSKLFIISNYNNNFYYTDANIGDQVKWDSLPANEVFGKWDNYNPFDDLNDKNAILSAVMFNDSSGLMLIGTSQTAVGFPIKEFKLNFAKITSYKDFVNVENYKIENERVFLWNSTPYPIPGKDIIRSHIYWNKYYKIENAIIDVYDIQGTKINSNTISIEPIRAYSGILTWECSEAIPGIYFILISLGGESISIPVIISK